MKKSPLLLALVFVALVSFSFVERPEPAPGRLAEFSGSLAFPVAGKKSAIKDKWGARRSGGKRKHMGIDIHARKGTPVVAITDGIIVERANMPVGGKTLWLRSDSQGWVAYYAHLDEQLVREGQAVRKGQVIGTVGNTGNAEFTPAHLHFGIDDGDGWVNPLPYVKNAKKVAAPKLVKKQATKTKKSSAKKATVKKKKARR